MRHDHEVLNHLLMLNLPIIHLFHFNRLHIHYHQHFKNYFNDSELMICNKENTSLLFNSSPKIIYDDTNYFQTSPNQYIKFHF